MVGGGGGIGVVVVVGVNVGFGGGGGVRVAGGVGRRVGAGVFVGVGAGVVIGVGVETGIGGVGRLVTGVQDTIVKRMTINTSKVLKYFEKHLFIPFLQIYLFQNVNCVTNHMEFTCRFARI
jgi:hypothetical protein